MTHKHTNTHAHTHTHTHTGIHTRDQTTKALPCAGPRIPPPRHRGRLRRSHTHMHAYIHTYMHNHTQHTHTHTHTHRLLSVPGITPSARGFLPMPLTPTTPRRPRQQSLTAWAPGPPRTDNSSNWERVGAPNWGGPSRQPSLASHSPC